MPALRKPQFLLAAIVVAALGPFLGKAFHIDDPLFLWMAGQIGKHPLDPYGFEVNWASFPEPFWAQMQNPPLCSYFIAAVGAFAGWSEIALHIAFLIWAVLAVLGTYFLARRWCELPFWAALLTLFTPVFLVSSTNVMCDVMMLAFWVWSIAFWIAGVDQNRFQLLFVAGLLVAVATMTKYFAITLVPLLAVYTLARDWKKWPGLFALTIPVVAAISYECWTKSLYGRGLLSNASFVARDAMMKFGQSPPTQILVGLAFAGGCIFAPFVLLNAKSKMLAWATGVVAVCVALFFGLVPINAGWGLGENLTAVRIEGGIFAAIGAATIALAVWDLVQRRTAESLLLFLWTLGTFAFTTFFNWSVTGRTILPMVPAVSILLVRWIDRQAVRESVTLLGWRVAALALVSLGVTAADFSHAQSARNAAREFEKRFRAESGTLWFQSHWGFQYYMQRFGAKAWNAKTEEAKSGDVIAIPANSTFTVSISFDRVFPPEEVNFPVLPLLTTAGRGTGACFYSSIRGPLPWAAGRIPPEMYYVARFR